MFQVELANRSSRNEYPEIGEWMAGSRLDMFTRRSQTLLGTDIEATEHVTRYLTNLAAAESNLDRLLSVRPPEMTES
jgi:hypothetical protein